MKATKQMKVAEQVRVAVVTGANRGIGLAICQKIASEFTEPLVLYATSRAGAAPPIHDIRPNIQVVPASLTLTNQISIDALVSRIRKEHTGIDVLIQNAGIYFYSENITAEQRRETLNVNYRGTLRMCQALLSVMRPGGRIVNLSSQSGQLHYFAPRLQERFLKPDLTLDELDSLVAEYDDASSKGTATAASQGWPPMAYHISKAALNGITRLLARDNPSTIINSCCPGWVATDLGGQAGAAPKTPDEGARIPFCLAFGDIQGISSSSSSSSSSYLHQVLWAKP